MKEGEKERRHKQMKEGVFTTLLDDQGRWSPCLHLAHLFCSASTLLPR